MKESEIRNHEVMDKYLEMVGQDVKRLFDRSKFEAIRCPACGGVCIR